jgi:hypothetical protein
VAIWAVPCSEVIEVLFDDDNFVYNVIVNPGVEWIRIEFEPGTAYLFQEKLTVKGYTQFVKQSIYFEVHGLSNETRNALEDLNNNCCLNVIAEDEDRNYHYCGISKTEEGEKHERLKTGDGSSETGANAYTDVAKYTETLTCFCDFYAMITLDPNTMTPLFWKKPDDNLWTKPDDEFWTIKQ